MKKKNIVLFSSGFSEQSGIVQSLQSKLEARGHVCASWRSLFATANDMSHIALLPILIKKIPTFDFAILICEGHDKTQMLRAGKTTEVNTMRDNVLFEIGLCSMALGLSKTILLTDEDVRMPDDLTGTDDQVALKRIIYSHFVSDQTVGDALIDQIENYIELADQDWTPVVIGAASATALGYLKNFIVRTLVYLENGFVDKETGEKKIYSYQKVHMHIALPDRYDKQTDQKMRHRGEHLRDGHIPEASFRGIDFKYQIVDEELHIYDYPSTMVTSYDTARMILGMKADDRQDPNAEERFTSKEIKLFYATLKTLISLAFVEKAVCENYKNLPNPEQTIQRVYDIIANRLEVVQVSNERNEFIY